MFGITYSQLFLIIGATAVLISALFFHLNKPKDLPGIARAAGALVGKAVGNVLLVRRRLEPVVQQSEAIKVHKELRETLAQYEVIRHEMRSMLTLHPDPFTRRLDILEQVQKIGSNERIDITAKPDDEIKPPETISQVHTGASSVSSSLHSHAIAYAKIAEGLNVKSDTCITSEDVAKPNADGDLLTVLPVSAETVGLLSKRDDEVKGSDIMLEAILEEKVARDAKDFFSLPENQVPNQ